MDQPAASKWREEPPGQSLETHRSLRTRRFVLLLLVCALAVAGVVTAMMFGVRSVPHPRFTALWVTEHQAGALPPRNLAERDRDAFRDGRYFDPPIPADEASLETHTFQQRLAALRSVSRYETVVLYLSAYAQTRSVDNTAEILVLPANADLAQTNSSVPFRDVLQALKDCPAWHKLLILDLLPPPTDPRLGLLVQDVPALVQSQLNDSADPARLVLCSCSPGQTPLYSEDQRRSVFSYYVEEGLRGGAEGFNPDGKRNGQVSARELGEFVRARVDRWAWRNRHVHQTPLLIGDADFPLLALERRQAKPPLSLPDPDKYPEWLSEAWKVRQRWRGDDSYRLAPQLYRQLETTLLQAERDWRDGVDAETVREMLKARLVRLEQKLKKANVAPLAKPPSLALEANGRPPKEELVEKIAQAMPPIRTKPLAPDEKKVPVTVRSEFLAELAKIPTFDLLYAAFEAAANDPNPHPDHIRFLNLLIQSRQPEPQYVETLLLERLDELAEQTGTEKWPTDTVRQTLDLVRVGETAAAQPQVFPLIQDPLEEAAQKRYESELLLLGGFGYAPPRETTKRVTAAAERYEAAQRRGDTVREIQRLLDDAFVFLPEYVPYLERVPEQESTWLDAVDACTRLMDLLAAGPADLTAAAQPMTQLDDDLRRLGRPFNADALADLQARLHRHQVSPVVLSEAEAILSTPFLAADEREALWKAMRGLTRQLHEQTVQQDQSEAKLKPVLLDGATGETPSNRLNAKEGQRALQRARVSLALLRLGGLPTDDLRKLDEQLQQAADALSGASGRDLLTKLGDELRRTWLQRVPELLRPDQDVSRRDRLSRVYLPFDPGAVVADDAPLPQTELRMQRQRALMTWRLDRNRYEGRELNALGLLSEKGVRFYNRAGTSYQTLAGTAPREPLCQITSDPSLLRITPSTTSGTATLTFQDIPAAAGAKDVPVRVLMPGTNWLRVTPGLAGAVDLDEDTLLHLPGGETASLPLTIRLKSEAEGPPPQGLLVETPCGRRTVHYRLPVSLDAVSERIEILLSVNPREPADPLEELRLRPLKSRQAYYVYLRNPSAKVRKVMVQLASGQAAVPGGEAKVELAANETKQIRFTAPSAPPPPPPPSGGAAPPAAEGGVFTELSGDLKVRLLDLDDRNKIIDERSYRVRVASAADYTKVASIQFTPPTQRDQSLGTSKNKLTVTLQATPALTGAPCPVELLLPPSRIPGFLSAKSGTMRGQLSPRGEVTLYAENLQFADGLPEEGYVYLSVDGDERAYVFHTTCARLGEPTSPREDTLPGLRLAAGRFAASGGSPSVTLEVDHPPPGASVELSLGHYQDGNFEPEATYKKPTAKRQRIACSPASTDGALLFEASTGDWVIQPETGKIVGARVLRGRLLDKEGVPLRTVYETLTLDDAAPKGLQFVDPPKLAKKDAPLTLKAVAGPSVSGVNEVFFFVGKEVQGKPPQGAALVPAHPLDDAKTTWEATLPLRVAAAGPADFTVQFVNRAGQSAFATTTIELIDGDPEKVLPGRIEGVVMEGSTPIPGLTVSLRNEKNVELQTTTTDDNGVYKFEKLTPGKYLLFTSRKSNKRQGSAVVNVTAEQTTKVPPIKLYLP